MPGLYPVGVKHLFLFIRIFSKYTRWGRRELLTIRANSLQSIEEARKQTDEE